VSVNESVLKTVAKILGPYFHNSREIRRRLSMGETVTLSLKERKYALHSKGNTLFINGEKTPFPLIPFDDTDRDYQDAIEMDGDGQFCLPDDELTERYFSRFSGHGVEVWE
tara:strand:+ start:15680 stop:16012 length:333 start_codon:yes stop_codon:yes gene_type:complete